MSESLAVYGQYVKPHLASPFLYRWRMAKKGPKRNVSASPYAQVLSENLLSLFAYHKEHPPKDGPVLSASPALAAKTKMSTATINRAIRCESSATLDTLTAIATAYDLAPWQLLIPKMDPKNPPVIAGLTAEERAFYRKIAQAAREYAAEAKQA